MVFIGTLENFKCQVYAVKYDILLGFKLKKQRDCFDCNNALISEHPVNGRCKTSQSEEILKSSDV